MYIITFIVGMILSGKLAIIILLVYILFGSYCAVKAYNDDYVYVEPLENIIGHFVKDTKNTTKKPPKTSEDDPLGKL